MSLVKPSTSLFRFSCQRHSSVKFKVYIYMAKMDIWWTISDGGCWTSYHSHWVLGRRLVKPSTSLFRFSCQRHSSVNFKVYIWQRWISGGRFQMVDVEPATTVTEFWEGDWWNLRLRFSGSVVKDTQRVKFKVYIWQRWISGGRFQMVDVEPATTVTEFLHKGDLRLWVFNQLLNVRLFWGFAFSSFSCYCCLVWFVLFF